MTESITTKLAAIQSELKAPKGQFNKFGGYKYRSCEDILEAVKPLLKEQGCAVTLSDVPEVVGEWHYICATATITDGPGTIAVTAYARESETKKGMDASQITGTASSYARKYALNGLFAIDDTKDADATNDHQDASKPQQTKTGASTRKKAKPDLSAYLMRIAELQTKCIELGATQAELEDGMNRAYDTTDVQKLTKEQLTAYGQWLNQVIEYRSQQ